MDMKKLMNEPICGRSRLQYFNKITLNCMLFFMEMMMNIYIFFKPDDDEINEGMNDSLGPHMGKAQQVGLFGRAETRGP